MVAEQAQRGPENWDGVARCVLAAQSDVDIDCCDQLYPPGGSQPAEAEPQVMSREDQVCVVMVSIFALELETEAEAAGEAPPELSDEAVREAHSECLMSLDLARQAGSPADYALLLDCLASSESSVDLNQCVGG